VSLNFNLIGLRIKESRLQKQISQAELAERIDLSASYISHIETAKKQASLESLVRIANALEVTVDHMLNGDQTSDPAEYRIDLVQLLEGCTSYEKRIIYEIATTVKKSLRDNKWLQRKDDQL
jgi:transcriptional regulator with XRE-family HTH domain